MPKLAINEITTRNWTFEQDVQGYAAAGISGIGVWRYKLEAHGIEQGIQLLRELNMQVADVCFCGLFTQETKEALGARMQDAREGIELTARLSADCLIVVTGPPGRFSHEEAVSRVIDCLKELAPLAEQKGVRLALEPIHPMYRAEWSVVHTLEEALDIVDAVGSPNVGVFFDVYHLWWERRLFEQIRRAAGRIFGVHINDWRQQTRSLNDRTIMGQGVIPLKQILTAIAETGYDGFYDVEIFSEELWEVDYHELVVRCKEAFETLWA